MKQNIFYLYPIFFLQKPLLSDVLPTIFLHINVHIACWKFYPLVETYQSSLKSCPIVFHMLCVSVKVLTKGRRDDYPLFSQTFCLSPFAPVEIFCFLRRDSQSKILFRTKTVSCKHELFHWVYNSYSRTISNILLRFFTVCLSVCLRNHICSKNSNSICLYEKQI